MSKESIKEEIARTNEEIVIDNDVFYRALKDTEARWVVGTQYDSKNKQNWKRDCFDEIVSTIKQITIWEVQNKLKARQKLKEEGLVTNKSRTRTFGASPNTGFQNTR